MFYLIFNLFIIFLQFCYIFIYICIYIFTRHIGLGLASKWEGLEFSPIAGSSIETPMSNTPTLPTLYHELLKILTEIFSMNFSGKVQAWPPSGLPQPKHPNGQTEFHPSWEELGCGEVALVVRGRV